MGKLNLCKQKIKLKVMKLIDIKVNFSALKMNKVVKSFIVSDFLFWGGWGFLSPIFAIFILQRIHEANVFAVGVAATIYYFTKAFSEVPISFYLDKHEGEKDDFYALVLGLFLAGVTALLFLSVKSLFALFLTMIVQGVAFALYSTAWPAIFSRHLDEKHFSLEWALDHFGIDFVSAIASFFGGGAALIFGFEVVFLAVAVLAFISAFILFLVPDLILPRGHMKLPFFKQHGGSAVGQ